MPCRSAISPCIKNDGGSAVVYLQNVLSNYTKVLSLVVAQICNAIHTSKPAAKITNFFICILYTMSYERVFKY